MEETSGVCKHKIVVLTECTSFAILTTPLTTSKKKLPFKGLNISVARNYSKFKQNKVSCITFVLMMHNER